MESFVDGPLTLEMDKASEGVTVTWRGRSVARDPAIFVLPILMRAVEEAQRSNGRVVLDFRQIEYLNSSTITPVVRVLEQAKRGDTRLTVRYDSTLKWQSLAFSALYLFGTPDGRVTVQGS